SAFYIRVIEIEASEPFIKMAFEGLNPRSSRLVWGAPVGDKLTITAIAHAGLARSIPQIASRGCGDSKGAFTWVRKFTRLVVSIIQRPHLFDKVSRIGAHRPFMAVRADFALDIKIVQQNEIAGELMKIRSNPLGEQAELRVAVSLGHVTEDLVVGAVFLNHVQTVLYWGITAQGDGDRTVGRRNG